MRDSPAFAANIFGYDAVTPLNWRTTGDYLTALEEPPAINIATLVPLGKPPDSGDGGPGADSDSDGPS